MKQIEELIEKLRGEMSTRMNDSDIVDILEVLQSANEQIDQLQKDVTHWRDIAESCECNN